MPALASVANVDIINFGSFLIEICWLHLQIKLPLFADAAEACVSAAIHVKLLKQAGWRDSCKRQCSLLANLQPVVPSHQLWGFTCDLFACDLKHEAVPVELSAASVDNSACELPVPSDAAPAAAKGKAKVNGKREG